MRFLFATIPITAHSTNPLPIAARLVEAGHDVVWYAGTAFHHRIAATGAVPLPYDRAHDFGGVDLFDAFPQLRGRSGPAVIGEVFADIFIGHAPERVADLADVLARHDVDAMLCDGLMYGVGLTSELTGIPWATFGDGPLPYLEPDNPPFGPGLMPMAGPVGRLRNRAVGAIARATIFRAAQRRYDRIRFDLGLPPSPVAAIDASMSPMLHLQGCTPGFEYPRQHVPSSVRWVGALRPDPVPGWVPPPWWPELTESECPVVHVTQGSLRADMTELVVPSVRALAEREVLAVVTTGGPTEADVAAVLGAPVPANIRVVPFVPYDDLLAHVDVMVTNGGYSGVTLALAHGVPLVQAGTTEEKPEIAARIQWSGTGLRLGTTRPSAAQVGRAVDRVLDEPSFREAAGRIRDEMAPLDAGRLGARALEELVAPHARGVGAVTRDG